MDESTGLILRAGAAAVVNPYDLPALETALRIKEAIGGEVTVFTMGPRAAEQVVRDAYALGADRGYLVCDTAFAGADVLATAYTLCGAIAATGVYDLILCGRQTTDGDTAQVSGSIAKWLELPHLNWVTELVETGGDSLTVKTRAEDGISLFKIQCPCLLSVERNIYPVRMPSLKLKLAAGKKPVDLLNLQALKDQDPRHYGLDGSATRVKQIYRPQLTEKRDLIRLDDTGAAAYIYDVLSKLELVPKRGGL
jgi:electron transfer flavoprotein beta subunit